MANGAYDVFIDVRDDLTPEKFCASQLIIKEAGGFFSGENGEEITTFSMQDRFSVISSATRELLKEIIEIK